MYCKPRLIAEVGCNHKGEMQIAKELIKIAGLYCKCDVIKFQKRNNKELLTEKQYNAPHPNPANSYGKTYGEHREFLEFNLDQHKQLKDWCFEYGVSYPLSVKTASQKQGKIATFQGFLGIFYAILPSHRNNE